MDHGCLKLLLGIIRSLERRSECMDYLGGRHRRCRKNVAGGVSPR